MYLFAYGTLMTSVTSRLGIAQRARLLRQSTSLGTATMTGQLYDLGRYPGLVLTEDTDLIVHGELFELTDPGASLRWLDAYEGIVPGDHQHNEYERRIRPATTAAGVVLDAWVYVWRGDPLTAQAIPDGRWPPAAR